MKTIEQWAKKLYAEGAGDGYQHSGPEWLHKALGEIVSEQRELLAKYMALVLAAEGITFLDHGAPGAPEFSEDERRELAEAEKTARAYRDGRDWAESHRGEHDG